MANNITAPAGGVAFATDEIAGVHFPYAKLAFGAEATAIAVADAAGARLPVTVAGTVTVSGGLTNSELRAAAVPVSFSGQSVGITGSVAVTAAALPLPTGAATSALQTAGNTSLSSIDGKLASLGQKAMAGSAPVVIASDQAAVATYADGFGKTVASNTITRLANVTAYASGQLIGGSAAAGFSGNGFSFAGFARLPGGVVRLERARLYKSQATAAGSFELRIYRAQPTISIGDAGAVAAGVPVGNAASAARLVGRFAFDMTTAALGSDGAELAALPVNTAPVTATLPGGTSDLFGLLVATGPYTPATGETFSVVLEGYSF